MYKSESTLLVEYRAAHDSFHHYDTLRVQYASMLIASSLVIWGFLISSKVSERSIGIASLLISLISAGWFFYAHHYRQLFMSKLFRIHEIERELGMELNLRLGFLGITKMDYKSFGPKGHNIDLFIFILIPLFGPILTLFEKGFSLWLVTSLPIIFIAIVWISNNERKMRSFYKSRLDTTMTLLH
jgi:hypothetical protein